MTDKCDAPTHRPDVPLARIDAAVSDLTPITDSPAARVILLGASNLTLGFPMVVQALRNAFGAVHIYAAHGHGRSYGMGSRVLCRTLPGICSSPIWHDLRESNPPAATETYALITDVGNDVIYGASIDRIIGWVETCLQRLEACQAQVVVATLPMASILGLGRVRYTLTKACFFPGKGPAWGQIHSLAAELDDRLTALAERFAATVVAPRDDWYGFDPIHIRRSRRHTAWDTMLAPWGRGICCRRAAISTAVTMWRLRPAERRLCGREQRQVQPAFAQDPGFRVSIY